jgi:hypothetical protein
MDARNWPRIYNLGGMAFPDSNGASQFVADWRKYRPQSPPYYLGWGYGADLGGLASQPDPSSANAISYPFKSLDGSVTFQRQRTGDRTFDYNTEGVAHYGLYPDWLEEVRKLGGPGIAQDMLHGTETYLEMWERAEGIKAYQCLPKRAKLTRRGLGNLRFGLGPDELLRSAGQPLRRTQSWTYCVKGGKGNSSADAVLTPEGKVVLVASNAPGHRAKGIAPGARASLLRGRAKPIGHKVWVTRLGKRRVAYVVRKGKVRTVAVATKELRGRKALRKYLRLVPSGGAPQHPRMLPVDKTLTDKNAEPLRLTRGAKQQISFICGLAADSASAPAPATPFAPPL